MYKHDSFKTGEGFHRVAIDMVPDDILLKDDDFHWFVPSIVNMAFACELYLKSIISDGISETQGHDLMALFNKLNEEEKAQIILEVERERIDDFYTSLKESRNLFESWRYHFEQDKSCSVCLIFLELFAKALHDLAENNINKAI